MIYTTSALIVLSHNDLGVVQLIVGGKLCLSVRYKFSARPVPSPSNRAVNQVSRSIGRARRAFVRIAPYILDNPCNDKHFQTYP